MVMLRGSSSSSSFPLAAAGDDVLGSNNPPLGINNNNNSNNNNHSSNNSINNNNHHSISPNHNTSGTKNVVVVVRSLLLKALCVAGAAFLLRKLQPFAAATRTRRDHAKTVAQFLSGEKISTEQAARDPMTYFNLRMLTCPATVLANGSRVLYFEQAFWRSPEKPYRQRFFEVKPCPNEMKCDVEVGSFAVRDVEEYRNFCDRLNTQRPQPEEIAGDMAEHLSSVYLSRCKQGQRCLYEGSTPAGGFPNSWNGATYCTSELSILRNGEVHSWDRGYDDEGNQVWGVTEGPYVYKPSGLVTSSSLYQNSAFL